MSADVADAETEPKKRGGPRGERAWRDKPTARERVLNGSLAEFIKESTGRDVSPETVRAVRFCLLKWTNSDETKKLREDMDSKLAKAKLQDEDEEDEEDEEDSADDDDVFDDESSDDKVSASFG